MAFEAKYSGWCRNCGERIGLGDCVDYLHGQIVHDQCPDEIEPAGPGRQEEKCPDCLLTHAGECF